MSGRIIIIGAGISGLAAGCYGQINGYKTDIFEMHNQSGGVCTSWKRKDYTIDGCIHWLVGSGPKHNFYKLYQEVGTVQGRKFVNSEEFMRVEAENGKTFHVFTDVDKLEQHMKELSPFDKAAIEEFTSLVRRFKDFNPPISLAGGGGVNLCNIGDALKMLPYVRSMTKYGKISVVEFAAKFRDPFLSEAFLEILKIPEMSIMSSVLTLGLMSSGNAGYPVGGSLEFVKSIERNYLALGGQIHYQSKVRKILVKNNQATGIQLNDGTEYKADVVISAADGHSTIYELLEGKYLDEETKKRYDTAEIFDPLVYVSLGVALDLSREPTHLRFKSKRSVKVDKTVHTMIGCTNYSFDPTAAPPGKTVLVSMFPSNYDYWKSLANDRQQYNQEKERIAQELIAALETRFPGLAEKVEVFDVATPLTFERYTGNWRGAYEGWLPTTENYGETFKNTLPGLEGFFLIGQWIMPGGGIPTGIVSGRNVISHICKQEKKPFKTASN